MKKFLILAAVLGVSLLQAQQVSSPPPTVVVYGEGRINVVPDQVVINSRIEHEGENPQQVKMDNDAVVNKVIKYLKSQGIPEKNIRTTYVNLNKNYNYNEKTYSYIAYQSIAVKLEDLRGYEFIISGMLEAGLNRIDGIEFMSSRQEVIEKEARKKAMQNARSRAEEYAGALNQEIGKAVRINEMENTNFNPVHRTEMLKMQGDNGEQETLSPGEMQVTAKVEVSFLLE